MLILSIATLLMVTHTVTSSQHCNEGVYGEECQDECNANCAGDNNNCDSETGDCIFGCDSGFYGTQCEFQCHRCAIGTVCNGTTGHCPHGCESGWFRPKCDSNCDPAGNVSNCWFCGVVNETIVGCILCNTGFFMTDHSDHCFPCTNCLDSMCNPTNGHCTHGCKPGWTPGTYNNCSEPCSENCIRNECDEKYGWCTHGCTNRTYKYDCSKTCPGMCAGNTCQRLSGTCEHGCEAGYMGPNCEYSCEHCAEGICDPGTKKCTECKPQWYGEYCEKRCSNCVDELCSHEKGCINGCIPGKRGAHCNENCGENCFACAQNSGDCKVCKSGYTGSKCDVICQNCTNPIDMHSTKLSYHGNCDQGFFGASCERRCNENCGAVKGETIGKCYKFTGICRDGCKAGFYGEFCSNQCGNCSNNICDFETSVCSSGCSTGYFSKRCNEKCPANCKDQICYRLTGDCKNGCEENYEGDKCIHKVKPYEVISAAGLVGIIGGTIIGVSLTASLVKLYFKYRKKVKELRGVYFNNETNPS